MASLTLVRSGTVLCPLAYVDLVLRFPTFFFFSLPIFDMNDPRLPAIKGGNQNPNLNLKTRFWRKFLKPKLKLTPTQPIFWKPKLKPKPFFLETSKPKLKLKPVQNFLRFLVLKLSSPSYQNSFFNAERQIEKLWILIFEFSVLPDLELYPSRQLPKQLLSSLGHLSCYLSSQYNKNAQKKSTYT